MPNNKLGVVVSVISLLLTSAATLAEEKKGT